MIVKINFPKEVFVLSSLGEALIETMVRLALTAFVFAIYKVVPAWTVVLFPFALIPLLLFTLGLGLMLSLLNESKSRLTSSLPTPFPLYSSLT